MDLASLGRDWGISLIDRWWTISWSSVKSVKEHDEHQQETLHQLQEANLSLNDDECEFAKPSVEFLGTIVNSEDIQADPKQVEAITEMTAPKDQSELRRFLGLFNHATEQISPPYSWAHQASKRLSTKNHGVWGKKRSAADLLFCLKEPHFPLLPCPLWYKPSDETLHRCLVLQLRSWEENPYHSPYPTNPTGT